MNDSMLRNYKQHAEVQKAKYALRGATGRITITNGDDTGEFQLNTLVNNKEDLQLKAVAEVFRLGLNMLDNYYCIQILKDLTDHAETSANELEAAAQHHTEAGIPKSDGSN